MVLCEAVFNHFTWASPQEVPESVGLVGNKHKWVQVILCYELLTKQNLAWSGTGVPPYPWVSVARPTTVT
jgi:hypothetical protein